MANSEFIGAGREPAHRAPRKTVLDVCCGGRMFWFDKKDPRTIYLDIRIETVAMKDCKAKLGFQTMHIRPDIQSSFTALPFLNGVFDLVVFDPPHLIGSGDNCWLTKRYGVLRNNWRLMLSEGFAECFRVLRSNGTLIFKWNETDMPISDILKLTKMRPLFGHKSGRLNKTHWVSFLKEGSPVLGEDNPALNIMGKNPLPKDYVFGFPTISVELYNKLHEEREKAEGNSMESINLKREDIKVLEVKLKNGNIQFQAGFEVGIYKEISEFELIQSKINLRDKIKEELINFVWEKYRSMEDISSLIFLSSLKKLCDEYDSKNGSYPESQFEGESIYDFAVERANKEK